MGYGGKTSTTLHRIIRGSVQRRHARRTDFLLTGSDNFSFVCGPQGARSEHLQPQSHRGPATAGLPARTEKFASSPGLYLGGTIGRDRNHCSPDCAAAACCPSGARSSSPIAVLE